MTHRKHHKNQLAIAVAVAGLQLTGTSAVAVAAETAGLEEIIVTATRRDQTVQEIPFNISAISGESLEKANIIDSVEALRTVAGISIVDRGYRNSGMTNGIVIRGINVDANTNGDVPLAAPPTVATYIDNTALYGNFILKDIDRIEVLRGPQGTLYGSGSLAGNVRYIMNKPDPSEFSGKASVNYGQTKGSGGYNINPDVLLNIPLGETAAIRANVGQVKNDGIVDYPHVYALDSNGDPVVNGNVVTATPVYREVEDADDVDIKYLRAAAYFEPSDCFNAELSYQRQEDDTGGRRQITHGNDLVEGGQYGNYEYGAVQLEPAEREVELTALEMEFGLGFATLTSSTSYYEHTGSGTSDNSGVYARNGWFAYYGSSPRPMAQAQRFYDDSAWTQEVRLVSPGKQFIDWTVGLYYTEEDYDLGQDSYLVGYLPYLNAINWYGLAPYTNNSDFLFRRNQQYKEAAAYGELTFNFSDAWHLTLGGRYFDNEVDVDAFLSVPIYANPPGIATKTVEENDFLFKANLAWDVSDNAMLYATFSQGYRHAGANAVPITGRYAENPDYFVFDSDSVDNYELGFKGTMDALAYSVSLYYTDWQNPQLNTSTSNWGFFAAINGESASTRGIEIELSGELMEHLRYSFGYTYADTELTDDAYKPSGNFFGSGVLGQRLIAEEGDRLPGTAEHVFNASLAYDISLGAGIDMSTVLSGYYQSDVLNALGSDNPADATFNRAATDIHSFQLWNLSSTFTKDAWNASLYVKNLFDSYGTTGKFTKALGGPVTDPSQNFYGDTSRDYIALPRTVGISIGYDF